VHVVIELPEEAWSKRRMLTHVRVEAEIDGQRSVACLFPKTAVPEALQAEDTASAYACADAESAGIDADLEYANWDFASGRSVNFELATAQPVTLTASGGFGGRIGLFKASATVDPGANFPQVSLELVPDEEVYALEPGCPLSLSSLRVAPFRCGEQNLKTCIFSAGGGFNGHTSAVSPLAEEGCRIDNAPQAAECALDEDDRYVSFGAFFSVPPKPEPNEPGEKPDKAQARVTLKGRFARCTAGTSGVDCPVTSDCVPPVSAVSIIAVPIGDMLLKTERAFSCLPPTVVPVEFTFLVPATQASAVNAGFLEQAPDASDDRCFFDLYEFDIEYAGTPSKPAQ
jgi:hypothetical protein